MVSLIFWWAWTFVNGLWTAVLDWQPVTSSPTTSPSIFRSRCLLHVDVTSTLYIWAQKFVHDKVKIKKLRNLYQYIFLFSSN